MFARIHTLFLLFVFALCVSASVVPRTDGAPVTCNANTGAGTQQCCDSLSSSSDPLVSVIAGLLGIVVQLTGLVGLTCNPITVLGLGSTQCNQQAVCCTGNSFNGVLVLGCSPININL